jgi:alginate O-acetyltransferase complex protein AlgI
MAFNTFSYFLFLPVLFLLFLICTDRFRWLLLLVASFIFYAFLLKPLLLFVLLAVIVISFFFGILIEKSIMPAKRKKLLWLGISGNLFLLILMKYLPFTTFPIISIGVSFYVFQAISYLADVYLNMAKAETHFGYFALYLSFFPKLLQGPIERAGHLLPQLKAKYEFNYANFRFGLLLFTWGLFKKVVIADRLGIYVDVVYDNVHAFSGLPLLLSTYAYAFQIYMDFSGYTDMALGSARLFNINLTQNFNNPFMATSVADYWRRWHITLSRWIFDYVFEPLQMTFRKYGKWGTMYSLFATFLVCGIWHGASWGYVIWGLLYGLFLSFSIFYRPYQKKFYAALGIEKAWFLRFWKIFVTFNLISFAFVFFRSNTLGDAFYIITHTFAGKKNLQPAFVFSQGKYELSFLFMAILIYFCISVLKKNCDVLSFLKLSLFKKCLAIYSFLTIILIIGKFHHSNFMYFKF